MNIASGQTAPDDWVDYISDAGGVGHGIYVDVETSAGRYRTTPHYLTSLEGTSRQGGMWRAAGVSAIYNPTPTGFRVYLCWADTNWGGGPSPGLYPNPLTAQAAEALGWYIRWTGIETT